MADKPPIVRRKAKKQNSMPSTSLEVEVQDKYKQSDDPKKHTSRYEEYPSISRTQSNIPVPDTTSLILDMYTHMKEFMAQKNIRIVALKAEHKSTFKKLCKMNPLRDFTMVGLTRK